MDLRRFFQGYLDTSEVTLRLAGVPGKNKPFSLRRFLPYTGHSPFHFRATLALLTHILCGSVLILFGMASLLFQGALTHFLGS